MKTVVLTLKSKIGEPRNYIVSSVQHAKESGEYYKKFHDRYYISVVNNTDRFKNLVDARPQ